VRSLVSSINEKGGTEKINKQSKHRMQMPDRWKYLDNFEQEGES
jgi:hypothetical protein